MKLLAFTLALALTLGASCQPSGVGRPAPTRVDVTMSEYRFAYDGRIAPGRVVFHARNSGRVKHEVVLAVLPPDVPPIAEQVKGSTRRSLTSFATLPARRPGERSAFAVDLAPGRYALLCFLRGSDGIPHARKGMASEFRVR